jgi:replicative DNA helicase
MEMTDSQLVDKVFSDMGNIPFSNIRDTRLSDNEMDTLLDTSVLIEGLPIRITEVNHMTPAMFRALTNRMVRKGRSGLVLLDYWQLCHTSTDEGVKRNELAAMSRTGKIQCRSLDIPICFAAQLNRLDGHPSLKHIADCDNLARDCDLAMLLERTDEKKDVSHGYCYGTNMLLRKNRQGPNRDIPLIFEGSFQRLIEERFVAEQVK